MTVAVNELNEFWSLLRGHGRSIDGLQLDNQIRVYNIYTFLNYHCDLKPYGLIYMPAEMNTYGKVHEILVCMAMLRM